jgi:hypothetical protein
MNQQPANAFYDCAHGILSGFTGVVGGGLVVGSWFLVGFRNPKRE